MYVLILAALAVGYSIAVKKELIPNFLAGKRYCTTRIQQQRSDNWWPDCNDGDGGNGVSKVTFLDGKEIGQYCRYVDPNGHCCQELPEFGERDCPR